MSYGMPCFYYRNKMICHLWMHKKINFPYIALTDGNLINHPFLLQEGRKRMKIFLVDPTSDLPLSKIKLLLNDAIHLHQNKNE